jgi:hypothetical protein
LISIEEMLYAQLSEADLALKARRDIEEKEARKKQVEERMKVLNWQKDTRDAYRAAETRKEREEKEMLKTQWKEEDQRAKATEEERLKNKKELNVELIKHNELEKGLKGRLTDVEKDRDKAMIAQIMEENRKQAELEKEMKLKRLAEAKETLKTIDNRTELQRQEDLAIERLAEEEKNRQIAREDERYKREMDAKIKLMTEVYEDRAKAVDVKSKHTLLRL